MKTKKMMAFQRLVSGASSSDDDGPRRGRLTVAMDKTAAPIERSRRTIRRRRRREKEDEEEDEEMNNGERSGRKSDSPFAVEGGCSTSTGLAVRQSVSDFEYLGSGGFLGGQQQCDRVHSQGH